MHPLFYETKHAHLSFVRFFRRDAAARGLTPARVDMLRAIQRVFCSQIRQSDLWRVLNVSKMVVSIMVRALERLGFVRRTRADGDSRTFLVTLTIKAKVALRALYHEAVFVGFNRLALAFAIHPSRTAQPDQRKRERSLAEKLRRIRNAFGRGDSMENPWHIADDDAEHWYAHVIGNPNVVERYSDAIEDDPEFDNDSEFVPPAPLHPERELTPAPAS